MIITDLLEGRTFQGCVLILLLTCAGYTFVNVVYNIYFHPLAKYPGPRLAAASGWWRVYIEAYKKESIIDRLFKLHEEYGGIVRIAPDELHFSDPAMYSEIYSPRSRWDEDAMMYPHFGEEASTFTTLEYREAKRRKDLVAPHFSRKSILSLQTVVQEGIDELCEIIASRAAEGKTTDFFRAFRCVNFDNVTSFCLGWSMHILRALDFRAQALERMHQRNADFHFWKHHPLLRALAMFMVRVKLVLMRRREPKGYFRVYKIDELCEIIASRAAEGKTTDFFRAFRCVNFDNVTSFCLGWSMHILRALDFRAQALERMHQRNADFHFWKHHPLLRALAMFMVRVKLVLMRRREPKGYFRVYKKIEEQVDMYTNQPEALENAPHPLIFHLLLDPAQSLKLSKASLRDEANLVIVAGTDTTSNASALGMLFALGGDGYIGEKLKAELRAAWPRLDEKPKLEMLESLPYLKLCAKSLCASATVSPLP
ncbi:uncharacterized protein PHACADRAFT_188850 [Phanerochaete carnosa HHB-10118-sp]|uniref:Cytochrome P450 n=1 Tax=Phanerochaete carnosa (strain HHB-10118-sp) TaxID=650164 RepID=K5VFC3_PHACS|nr:uncharacterized protein PHACADRAFT_188850 [Phanerochaete carnosa HHB-10118-sp]EKM49823.1 hypothetical protein PHACADRAFT_188850 [Phanerochaete carnosa HHB-10118-sp]